MNEIFKHFRLEHHHHFVNAHGNTFNGDIRYVKKLSNVFYFVFVLNRNVKPDRCDDSNMIMGVERKWAPTMMKLDGGGGRSDSLEIDENGGQEKERLINRFLTVKPLLLSCLQ